MLLEPNKGDLFLRLAEQAEMKPSAFLRDIAYKYIADNTGRALYERSEALDLQKRKDAINARLEGKAKKRWELLGLDNLAKEESSETPASQCGLQPDAAEDLDESSAA